MISTAKKAREHVMKIKAEMNEFLEKKAQHELRKKEPKELSLVDHMNSKGMISNWTARKSLAHHYGIKNYAGTRDQHGKMVAILNGNIQHDTTE